MHAVIDIGSNSVRLLIRDNGKNIIKKAITTALAEGLGDSLTLKSFAIERTAKAVCFLCEEARRYSPKEIFAFGTAAVRRAVNRQELLSLIKDGCGLDVEVVSGETEAFLGSLGALQDKDGGIIDIGGASTEINVRENGKEIYSKSLYIGAVRVTDICGQEEKVSSAFVSEKVKEYITLPKTVFYGIGGTITSLAAILNTCKIYNPDIVNGYILTFDKVEQLKNWLFALTVEERENIIGLQKGRAKIIANGTMILYQIMKTYALEKIIVSDSDNLEGYLFYKVGKV